MSSGKIKTGMNGILISGACALISFMVLPAVAHHSMAGFDRGEQVELKGTIVEFKWANPHSWIEIDVPDANGNITTWNIEMTAPAYLARAGWKRTTLNTGDEVTVIGNPLINGDPGALFVSVELSSGMVMSQRGGAPKGKGKAAKGK